MDNQADKSSIYMQVLILVVVQLSHEQLSGTWNKNVVLVYGKRSFDLRRDTS